MTPEKITLANGGEVEIHDWTGERSPEVVIEILWPGEDLTISSMELSGRELQVIARGRYT